MKKYIFFFLLFAFAVSINSYSQETISSQVAKDYIGQTLQVKGKVANIFTSPKGNTFINFDEPSPKQTFTAVVMSGTSIDISNIKENCTLTVYGTIKEYKGKPEIILENNEQIISVEQISDEK